MTNVNLEHTFVACQLPASRITMAHPYAIFLCSLDVEI